jgi:hypothetical protein
VFGSLVVALCIATVTYPLLREAGGAAKFFADTLTLAVYALLLVGAYYGTRSRAAED